MVFYSGGVCNLLFPTYKLLGFAVIGFSCWGVPAQIFKLLYLVYCYVLITSVYISFFFGILQGKANKIK